MNKRDSANIAREVAASWAAAVGNDSGGEDRDPARIHSATFDQVFEFFPADATVALIQRVSDNAPLVAAFKSQTLYLLEVLDFEGNVTQPPTRCRMIHVAPGRGTVEVETRYRQQLVADQARPPRSAIWRFRFEDETEIKIETFRGTDGEVEAQEALAKKIIVALGWEMDLPPVVHRLEAV